jgi:hypothetical protein
MRGGGLLAFAVAGVLMASGSSPGYAVGEGATCGGIAGIRCDGKLWCDPTPGQCGTADVAGTCVTVPEICTEVPVCGCDNKTYSNDCRRRAAKVAKKSNGACEASKSSK